MLSPELFLKIASTCHSLIKASTQTKIIDEIRSDLKNIYVDNAEAHTLAAKSNFEASETSKFPENEIRNGNSNLITAFHIYEALLNKTKTESSYIFFTRQIPFLKEDENINVRASLFQVSYWIAKNYSLLGESINKTLWKTKSLLYLHHYSIAATAHLTADFLYTWVDKKYALHITGQELGAGGIMPRVTPSRSYSYYELSNEGKQYIDRQQEEVRQNVKNGLDRF